MRYISNFKTVKPVNVCAMLELSKNILKKVSFDATLFQKELMKAITWIQNTEDLKKLREWCLNEFGRTYPAELQRAFVRI